MYCPHCTCSKTSQLAEKTSLGYKIFRCSECKRKFNERTGGSGIIGAENNAKLFSLVNNARGEASYFGCKPSLARRAARSSRGLSFRSLGGGSASRRRCLVSASSCRDCGCTCSPCERSEMLVDGSVFPFCPQWARFSTSAAILPSIRRTLSTSKRTYSVSASVSKRMFTTTISPRSSCSSQLIQRRSTATSASNSASNSDHCSEWREWSDGDGDGDDAGVWAGCGCGDRDCSSIKDS